jgi:nucleotide-binding universal stress UspA family protein
MAIRRIILGLDGSDGSALACRWCAELAGSLGAEVIAVHATDLPEYPIIEFEGVRPVRSGVSPEIIARWQDDQQVLLEGEWCRPLRDAQVRHRAVLLPGHPASVIMDTAKTEDADLIVVGSRGLGGFRELLLGSVSHQLTQHAGRPVVVVPAARG